MLVTCCCCCSLVCAGVGGRVTAGGKCKQIAKANESSQRLPKSMNITRLLGDPLPTLSGLPTTPPLYTHALPHRCMKDVESQLAMQCIQLQPAGSAKLCPRPTFHRSLLPASYGCHAPFLPSATACSFDTVFYYCAYCCIRFRFG